MATLYIREYATQGLDTAGIRVAAGLEPPLADQTVAIGASSTASAAFQTGTKFVRLHCDAICSILFGTAPTALATSARMAANQTEFFAVPPGQSYKVAVITNS